MFIFCQFIFCWLKRKNFFVLLFLLDKDSLFFLFSQQKLFFKGIGLASFFFSLASKSFFLKELVWQVFFSL